MVDQDAVHEQHGWMRRVVRADDLVLDRCLLECDLWHAPTLPTLGMQITEPASPGLAASRMTLPKRRSGSARRSRSNRFAPSPAGYRVRGLLPVSACSTAAATTSGLEPDACLPS